MVAPEPTQLLESLTGLDRKAASLWIDGHAKDLDRLAEFTELETLWIHRLPARKLKLVSSLTLPKLEALSIRHLSADDLALISTFPTLRTLAVWQSKSVVSLTGIETLSRLEELALMDLGPIESLAPLGNLTSLKSLALMGGIWTKQGVPSLEPLAALRNLESLDLGKIKASAGQLKYIAGFPKLRELGLSARDYPMEEIALVAAAYPFWFEDLLDLRDFDRWSGAPGCGKCGCRRKIMFIRKRKMLWCPECEKEKLGNLLKQFKDLVAQKRAGSPSA